MFGFEHEYQCHGLHHSLCSRSIANTNLCKSHTSSFFVRFHHFQDIYISKVETLKMLVKVMMYNIRSVTVRLQVSDFLSDDNGNVVTFTINHLSK